MPDPTPESDHTITVIPDKNSWSHSQTNWDALIPPLVSLTLTQAHWRHVCEINILLTDDITVQHLNKNYRHVDRPTNVLSFPSLQPEEISRLFSQDTQPQTIVLGDIALSFETVQKEALAQDKSFPNHVLHLVSHGILHLLGFDHHTDEEALIMESLEIKILSCLDVADPYQLKSCK
jgi:probable rRNA maturation factor